MCRLDASGKIGLPGPPFPARLSLLTAIVAQKLTILLNLIALDGDKCHQKMKNRGQGFPEFAA
jgi:hypothetical protein